MAKIDIPNLPPLAVALEEVFNMTEFCIKQRYVSIKTFADSANHTRR